MDDEDADIREMLVKKDAASICNITNILEFRPDEKDQM